MHINITKPNLCPSDWVAQWCHEVCAITVSFIVLHHQPQGFYHFSWNFKWQTVVTPGKGSNIWLKMFERSHRSITWKSCLMALNPDLWMSFVREETKPITMQATNGFVPSLNHILNSTPRPFQESIRQLLFPRSLTRCAKRVQTVALSKRRGVGGMK